MPKSKLPPNVIAKRTFEECLIRGYDNPVLFAQDFLDFKPHAGQVAWLLRKGDPHIEDTSLRIAKPYAKQANLHAANRWGKTQIEAVRLLHRAFYQIRPEEYKYLPGGGLRPYVAINVAMSLDQAMLAWNYAVALAKNSPKFSRFVADEVGTPFPKLVIGNMVPGKKRIQSEIWARSTAKGARFLLGKTFNFLSWDECAFEPDGKDILDGVIRMRLVDQAGDLEMLSSPNGRSWFYEQCQHGRDYLNDNGDLCSNPNVYTQRGETFDNVDPDTGKPNIDFASVHENMKVMSEDQIRQNIYGEFAESSNVFDITAIQQCYKDQDYKHYFQGENGQDGLPPNAEWAIVGEGEDTRYQITHHHQKQLRYVMGIDFGRKRDQTCIVVLMLPDSKTDSCQLVFFQMLGVGTPWFKQYDRIAQVYYRYHACPTLVDSTSQGGDMALEALQNKGLDVSGYNLAGGNDKDNLIFHLQAAIQQQQVKFPYIRTLVDQLIYYQFKDKNLQTDAVFGLAFAWENALRHGLGDSEVPVIISSPDLSPICVSMDSSGRATVWEGGDDDVFGEDDPYSSRYGNMVII